MAPYFLLIYISEKRVYFFEKCVILYTMFSFISYGNEQFELINFDL